MSDPKEKEVQAILQAIDYGHLPPRETQRRLLNIIQAEAARTDAPTDETKIHTCMDLLERLQGEQKPIAPARVDALRQHIAAAHQKNERKRQKRKKNIAAAACSAAAIAVAFAVSHPLLWYENWTTADEQQHFVTSHEIAIEMLETAVADPMLPTDDTVEVQSIAALDALIGRKTGIPEMVNGQWELQHRYVNFTRSGISISLMYVNAADAQQTIVGVINLISNPQYMMLSFEQSYEGTIQQFDGLNFYITENINKPVALWQGDDKLLLFSGRTSQEEVTSLLRTIIREIGEKMNPILPRIFALLLVHAALLSCAFADDSVEPCADVTFLSATCSLGMDKVATFTLMTDILADRIVVTNAWLEQQSNGRWVYVKTLAVPATIATNTISYSATLSYSSAITTRGTFRIGFTADADGHQITRYSNSRRFI